MALSYRTRKALSLLILVVGLPLYIVAAVTIVNLFDRPPIWLEFLVYVGLGILWALPFRAVFRGVGKADPDAPPVVYLDELPPTSSRPGPSRPAPVPEDRP